MTLIIAIFLGIICAPAFYFVLMGLVGSYNNQIATRFGVFAHSGLTYLAIANLAVSFLVFVLVLGMIFVNQPLEYALTAAICGIGAGAMLLWGGKTKRNLGGPFVHAFGHLHLYQKRDKWTSAESLKRARKQAVESHNTLDQMDPAMAATLFSILFAIMQGVGVGMALDYARVVTEWGSTALFLFIVYIGLSALLYAGASMMEQEYVIAEHRKEFQN